MTLTVTKGIAGRRIETIGKYSADEIDKMYRDFYNWKMSNKGKYRVEYYERSIIYEKQHKIIIDFGDYSHFALVRASKKEWPALMSHKKKPVNLDV